MSQRFSPENRLLKPAEFQAVYKGGKRLVSNYFVYFLKTDRGNVRRLGITVTKEVGKAVDRNRIKRQVREFFRAKKDLLPSSNLIVKARKGAAEIENSELKKDLGIGFKKLVRLG